jgi:Ca2+-binding RTX toxin-like protein
VRIDAEHPDRLLVDYGDDGRAERKVNLASVDNVVVKGRRGDDRLHLDELQAALPAEMGVELRGGDGVDTIVRSGSTTAADSIEMATDVDGERARLSNGASHAFLDGAEQVELPAGGGADSVRIFDLTGTDVIGVATSAGPADGAPDQVIAAGTPGMDIVDVVGGPGALALAGLPVALEVHDAEPTDDLAILTVTGDDVVSASTLPAGAIELSVDTGLGDDAAFGSAGADRLAGGFGNDEIDGERGNDTAILGGGDDEFVWNPGDGSDTVDGGSGTDELQFNGANAPEEMQASAAAGGRVIFTRSIGSIVMDLAAVEGIDVKAGTGADVLSVGDLSGTAAKDIAISLGIADGDGDVVNVAGTAGNDAVAVSGGAGRVIVAGLPATVAIGHAESADQLAVAGGAGQDTLDSAGLAPGTIGLTFAD